MRAGFALALGFTGDSRNVAALAATTQAKGVGGDYLGYVSIALGMLGGEEAEEALLHIAKNRAQEVDCRRGLALGMGLIGGPQARSVLSAMLLQERDPSARRAAAWAYGLSAEGEALVDLIQLWSHAGEDEDAQIAVVEALGQVVGARDAGRLQLAVSGREHRLQSRLGRAVASY